MWTLVLKRLKQKDNEIIKDFKKEEKKKDKYMHTNSLNHLKLILLIARTETIWNH